MGNARDQHYRECVYDIISNAARYHDSYYAAETFRGPSLYFHQRCVSMMTEPLTSQRIELIYATLASWGMHRMGKGGSKMVPFDRFSTSLLGIADEVTATATVTPVTLTEEAWQRLKKVFLKIRVMATETILVGNSKVMAHLLTALIPPIDREYTLRYLRGTTALRNDPEYEWSVLGELLEGFFFPIIRNKEFQMIADPWVQTQTRYPWDTSLMEVVDNLVIGAAKLTKRILP